ncbi:hypothetical protein BE21_58175 [Sorangium cellulosum]|uniref:Uncharacterized protein n=1 Tax=Sorangium cellulosum TaxID=56 RepID=A0A150U2G2_SORCE|nr:hypothetical protein BE21_58175 [Sorangium cellulosum]
MPPAEARAERYRRSIPAEGELPRRARSRRGERASVSLGRARELAARQGDMVAAPEDVGA